MEVFYIKNYKFIFILLGLTFLISGCSPCSDDLSFQIEPVDMELTIGESFIIKADAYTCSGKKKLSGYEWVYEAEDEDIIDVDEKGKVIALQKGTTRIGIYESSTSHFPISWIQVTVQ